MPKAVSAPADRTYLYGSVLPSPVGLVLVRSGLRRTATTVSFFSEVAHHPTSLWVSLAVSSFAHELALEGGEFTLAILSRAQTAVARVCGSISGRDRDKCAELPLYESPRGFLYLAGGVSSTACRVRTTIRQESHTVLIADMLEADIDTRAIRAGQLLTTEL
jgi:flavin reductase (DIM6/NTAB) family NADH-FMN oxidoreductase RutF